MRKILCLLKASREFNNFGRLTRQIDLSAAVRKKAHLRFAEKVQETVTPGERLLVFNYLHWQGKNNKHFVLSQRDFSAKRMHVYNLIQIRISFYSIDFSTERVTSSRCCLWSQS